MARPAGLWPSPRRSLPGARAGLATAPLGLTQLALENDAVSKRRISLVDVDEEVAAAPDAGRERQVEIAKDDLLVRDVEPPVTDQNGLHDQHDS